MTAVVIVGGGLSGLVRAHALASRGEEVRLFEASDRSGGAVRTERAGAYLRELGLSEGALLADPRLPRYIELEGRLHSLAPHPLTLATTRLLSTSAKLRLLREPFVRRGDSAGETVREFFTRRLGPQVADRLVAPFVSGIWAGDAARLSAASAFPLLAGWEREYGSLLRGAMASRKRLESFPKETPKGLLSFREGLETLPRALSGSLGPRFQSGTAVRSLRSEPGRWRIETDSGTVEAGRVVVATSARDAARLLEPLDADAARALAGIPHPPLAVLHLAWHDSAFPTPPSGFGHLVVPSPGRRILGAVWTSCLFPGRAPLGETLLTAFAGGSRDPAAAALPDDRLLEVAARELSASLGAKGAPRLVRITRYTHALPQYGLDHESRMSTLAAAEARLPGLSFLGNYRGGISVGDVIRNALAAARP
jgi:oxygen-dependent protoporphyrinogen oxidase